MMHLMSNNTEDLLTTFFIFSFDTVDDQNTYFLFSLGEYSECLRAPFFLVRGRRYLTSINSSYKYYF